jgi:hypothetical protein
MLGFDMDRYMKIDKKTHCDAETAPAETGTEEKPMTDLLLVREFWNRIYYILSIQP